MESLMFLLILPGMLQAAVTEEYDLIMDNSNATENSSFIFVNNSSEETPGEVQDVRLSQYQASTNLRVYKGPLPRFPGTTTSPWVALHSPVKIYLPIRNTGEKSAESEDCVQCPRNLIVQLPPLQKYIPMPVPTISLCSSFAHLSGRVHVAVISGPRPGERLDMGRHEVQLMIWKAMGPVHSCKYTVLVRGKRHGSTPTRFHVQNVPCSKPERPSNGMLLCVPNGVKYYPHNSVCQFFCLDNYLVKNTTTNSSTIICNNGRWSPYDHVSCVAAFCPKLPRPPVHGSWTCNIEDSDARFSNGTHCKVSCAPDFVIETSQTENAEILCTPPIWNTTMIPECKRAHLPKLKHCHNRHIIVKTGSTVKISDHLLPKGISQEGIALTPICSLQGKNIAKGKHRNICEVTDPELRTRKKCIYIIHIEESSGPRPHRDDCKNRTVFANRKGTIHSKPVRFLITTGKPGRAQVLRGNCTPRGDLPVGSHFIVCKAINPHTGTIDACSYRLNVKERTCQPLRSIPNGRTVCVNRTSGSVCYYECNIGYYFPDKQLVRSVKTCQLNLRWHPAWDPVCKIKPPTLEEGCDDLEVNTSSPINFIAPQPKFLTALNETLYASCIPANISADGLHHVRCKIDSDVFNVSCSFSVSILLEDQITTTLPPEAEPPVLVEGCEDMYVNETSFTNLTVPLPTFLSTQNETMDVSCTPNVITIPGIHQIRCSVYDNIFNDSCIFNITVHPEDEGIAVTSTETDELPKLVDGCYDLIVNLSSPINFTIPLPLYVTSQNVTLVSSCEPSYVTEIGQFPVKCLIENITFNDFCYFNITVQLENELITIAFLEKAEPPQLLEGCNDLEVNVSSTFNFSVPRPQFLTSENETLVATCEPSSITTTGQHQVKCLLDNSTFKESCHFNITVQLEDETVTLTSPETEKPPETLKDCSDLEVNVSSTFNFSIPIPQFLTSENETLAAACMPSFITTIGQHPVTCSVNSSTFSGYCYFNVTVQLNDETITSPSPEKESPELLEGCNDLEVNVSSPVNFSVPLPQFLTSQNETIVAVCEPLLLTTIGQHHIKCSVGSLTFNESCSFNVTVRLEDETITSASPEKESPDLLEGCSNLEVTMSSPINFSIPFPRISSSQNETLAAVCVPSFITTVGHHQVECIVDSLTPKKICSFNVTVLQEDEIVTLQNPAKDEAPKLVKGCYDLEVNVAPPFNFTIPSPRYLTSQNKTLDAKCQPSFVSVIGHYQAKCSVDNVTGVFCQFNVTVSLDEPVTTASPEPDSCKPLSPPNHGSIQCSSRGLIETCQLSCNPGFGFSDDYTFTAVCDGNLDGLWDFERSNVDGTLPECFAQVEGSAVELWISFEAFAPHCENELQEQMRAIIDDMCQLDANCSKYDVNCTLDEESDMMLVTLNWTVQADFNNEEYLDEEIPEAETRLENVLERVRAFVATADSQDGLHLFRDSFRRGHMTLVCPSGFAPDMMMANCVQCPMENSHCKQ